MTDIPWLHPHSYRFPPPENALTEPNGLLAVGGDLSPKRLVHAYRQGIFPWYEDSQPILWWTPSPRTVLFPANIKISRSLKKRLRRDDYRIYCDRAFAEVVQSCANAPRKGQNGTWITHPMLEAYTQLNAMGIAHSIEVWSNDKLVGGLYGLAIGKVFFGESMFSRQNDASKLALVYLCQQLQAWEFALIDCQVSNPHLVSLGAEEISREQFTSILEQNIDREGYSNWAKNWPSGL
jgi:leucyl/phenylalanyl-tRNA---protein transferase